MSGGVDSSVAAYLLKEEGYDVVGVTMQIWQSEEQARMEDNGGCCGLSAVDDARRVCEAIGIPHYVMNFRDIFREKVITYFVDEYLKGRTPNPCIACNRYVKWEALLERSLQIGADYIATGHYARILQLENGRYTIQNSVTAAKDQTYALYNLTQEQLARTLLPVGAYEKDKIRAIAADAGLPVAHKPDSQEICFIPDHDYAGYIDRECEGTGRVPGAGHFVLKDGTIVGEHKGITHYTIGQRKGLGIAFGHPVFVAEIRPETNEVVLDEGDAVFGRSLTCDHVNLMSIEKLEGPREVLAKIRYSHKGAKAIIRPYAEGNEKQIVTTGHGKIRVEFPEPVRAITPGQAVVFYEDEHVLGGGVIE